MGGARGKAMVFHSVMKRVLVAALALGSWLAPVPPALAEGFAPAATVNAQVITQYELAQRIKMMTIFRQPGDIPDLALQSLIDDALRRHAAKQADITVSPEELQAGMAEFASRANLPLDKFLGELDKGGVQPETLRDFVEAGLLWRNVVRAKYRPVTRISEAEIDRAIGAGVASGGEKRVLLSEIILPLDGEVDAMTLAQRIRDTVTSAQSFSVAAKNFSKAPSANAGGQLGWIGTSALPAELAPRILALEVGQMTDPIVSATSVQLYFLRDVSQAEGEVKGASEVEYIQFFAPAGLDLAGLSRSLDTCDDVYDLARGLPAEAVQRATLAEAGLPGALSGAIAALDPGETALLPGAGGTASLVMLCRRAPASDFAPSRADVADTLLNAKLGLLATAYLEELRSNAFIQVK